MKKIKLNVGCGGVILKDFINVDMVDVPTYLGKPVKNFVKGNILALPFKDNYADYIVVDNVLEHVLIYKTLDALKELKRVLKKGGRLVIFVPEFMGMLRMFTQMMQQKKFDPEAYDYVAKIIYGHQAHEGEAHLAPMTPIYLNYLLKKAGFKNFTMTMFPIGTKAPVGYPGLLGDHWKKHKLVVRCDMLLIDIKK